MSAGRYDLYVEQGATFERVCFYQSADGTPINLTGMTMAAQIRRSYSDSTITQAITITIPTQTGGDVGKFVLSMTDAQTSGIPVTQATDFENNLTNYTWDLELNTGTTVKRILQGSVAVSPEVTR
jgi:hypothetical protein